MSPVDRAGPIKRDLALPLFPLWKFRCVHMRTGPARSTEISVSATGISVDRAHMNWLQPGWPGWKCFNCAWLNGRLAAPVAAFWLICWIFHFKSIPFSCSSKVTRVDNSTTRGTIEISSCGAVLIYVQAPRAFFISVNRAEISPYEHTTGLARLTGLIWTGPKRLRGGYAGHNHF